MDNDRYRDKVRKLLALAESSNPHEAERARVQAKKIMAKYNIRAKDTEIIEVKSSSIPRRNMKDYESHLVGCINSVSGCESFFITQWQANGRARSIIHFVGVAEDAHMAAYCLDVLHNQLKRYQFDLKTNYGMNANQRNIASLAWVVSACEKLTGFFDYREVPGHVKDYYERSMKGIEVRKSRDTENIEDEDSKALIHHGYSHGSKALLNKAATHQSRDALSK